MPRKRNSANQPDLLDAHLSELAVFIKDLAPESRIEISLARYEDEDAHISIFLPPETEAEEVKRIELALGERCNDILVDTGLFIIGAVCD
jgi:pyruvate-formate lyase-activating enzyme